MFVRDTLNSMCGKSRSTIYDRIAFFISNKAAYVSMYLWWVGFADGSLAQATKKSDKYALRRPHNQVSLGDNATAKASLLFKSTDFNITTDRVA